MKHTLPLAATLIAALLPAQEPTPSERPFALIVGDPAPPLAIADWVQGEAIESFQPDHTYVVEFWATWCGPCIYGMPHLSELQEKHRDQQLRIVGVNIWDEAANVRPFLEKPIGMHDGKTGAEVMRYTVAIEAKDGETGKMASTWMEAAGRNGIPSAFIVSGGRVVWIGHPASLDDPLAQILAGDWDVKAEAAAYLKRIAAEAALQRFFELFQGGDLEAAYTHGRALMRDGAVDDPMALNALAWSIVDPDAKPPQQDLDLALLAAERASELTDHEDPSILDTLATVRHARGDLQVAVWVQRLAVRCADADDPNLADYRKRLAAFEAAAREAR